jgi:HSP20 family protein
MNTSVGDVITHKNVDYSTPLINVMEYDENYTLEMIAPGLTKSDINISIDKKVLTISSEKKYEGEQKFKVREFKYGVFKRSFKLPEIVDTDKISATMEDGILKLTLSKKDKAVLAAKKIAIK